MQVNVWMHSPYIISAHVCFYVCVCVCVCLFYFGKHTLHILPEVLFGGVVNIHRGFVGGHFVI